MRTAQITVVVAIVLSCLVSCAAASRANHVAEKTATSDLGVA